MLKFDVKRKINTLRDILVGKVPDPKAQVEQITIALIYKFMDDMDIEGLEFGGERQFFTGDYEKYAWTEIMKPENSASNRALLYGEGIDKMVANPNIPKLFRDIFRGTYVPYRDPETLNMFLKEVSDFTYDNSEDLGNAFEYLLSIMGSQGDAGQFRTPRHIIDMMVEIVDPKKGETILDPACGTAGFLISAYRHIIHQNKDKEGNITLTPDERKQLTENFAGYDISPDMVRLSRVNMYLHRFVNPNISEYDTLTSEEKWDDNYDVIFANPPFMTPKGGIIPHGRYRVKAKRSEVLFVDYIAEHLNPTGRAAIVVPEGIVFQSANAYKQLRKYLVEENMLYGVISLPAGVFNPYSGVKTSILLIDRSLAKAKDQILFIKLNNDGFDLGAQRREIKGSEIPEIIRLVKAYQQGDDVSDSPLVTLAQKSEIAHQNYILVGERYALNKMSNSCYDMVSLGDRTLFQIEAGGTPSSGNPEYWNGGIRWATLVDLPADNLITELADTERTISQLGLDNSSAKLLPEGTVLVSTRATIGRVAIAKHETATNQGFKNIIILDKSKVLNKYVAYMMTSLTDKMISLASGGTFKEISKTNFMSLQIPLPPISVQEEIVAELDSYQKIIDGARQVVDNYKPAIIINPNWLMKKISEAPLQIIDGDRGVHYPSKEDFTDQGYCLFLNTSNVRSGYFNFDNLQFISCEKDAQLRKGKMQRNDIAFTTRGTVGNIACYDSTVPYDNMRINSGMVILRANLEVLLPKFVLYYFQTQFCTKQIQSAMSGAAQPQLPIRSMNELIIPIPAIEEQQTIIDRLDEEKNIVEQNKRLISLFEQKIKDKIADVWGE